LFSALPPPFAARPLLTPLPLYPLPFSPGHTFPLKPFPLLTGTHLPLTPTPHPSFCHILYLAVLFDVESGSLPFLSSFNSNKPCFCVVPLLLSLFELSPFLIYFWCWFPYPHLILYRLRPHGFRSSPILIFPSQNCNVNYRFFPPTLCPPFFFVFPPYGVQFGQ